MNCWLQWIGAMSIGAMTFPALGIVGGAEPATNDTRFDAIGGFSRTEWLDDNEGNIFGNATLIEYDDMDPALAGRLVLIAKHSLRSNWDNSRYVPPAADEASVRFRRKPNGSLGSVAQGWQSFHQVKIDSYILFEPAWLDIAIGVLEEPVTHIQPIHVDDVHDIQPEDNIILSGWGKEGPDFDQGDWGKLLLANTVVTETDLDETVYMEWPLAWDPSNPCECGPNMFDSGGAVLVEHLDGSLSLVAVITATFGGVDVRPAFQPKLYPILTCPGPQIICGDTVFGCPDFNNDGFVDNEDLGELLADWGVCSGCPTDLNGNGVVGTEDLGVLFPAWGVADCQNPCLEVDLNNDGEIEGADLGLLLSGWGFCPQCDCCPADFDENGVVDGADLGYLMSFWGECRR